MENKPFLFISYSRKDYKVARDLQNRLEKYPYSKRLVETCNRPPDPHYVRPVFLDSTDLSARHGSFKEELAEKLRLSQYLLVICSPNAAKSAFVHKEIDTFLQANQADTSRVIPIYVDEAFQGMHPAIDGILQQRNCPIYKTASSAADKLANRYCFYHLLEFLLKVDFYLLYNRYLQYKRRKRARRLGIVALATIILIAALAYGMHNASRLAHFERKTFPYSLVVGYVDNFMQPMMSALTDSCPQQPHLLVFLPNTYDELDHQARIDMYRGYINARYNVLLWDKEVLRPKNFQRAISIDRLRLYGTAMPLYIDNANTVSAFKYVIDYKFRESPIPIRQTHDEMVRFYSQEFINSCTDNLTEYSHAIHFITDTTTCTHVLDSLLAAN